jgi:hypothetical protein
MSEMLTVKKSPKLKAVENGLWLNTYLKNFGYEFSKQWEKDSRSSTYWRIGRHASKVKPKPLPNKLTERSGNLRDSLKMGATDNISKVRVSANELVVTRGSRVKWANRQERQLGNKRTFLQRSLDRMGEKLNLIKKRATILTNGAFK